MIKACAITAAISVVVYSLWLRRLTWTCRWEKCTTFTIALMGASMILTNPWLDPILGAALWRITGWRDIENVLGHGFLIAAAAGIMHTATSRYLYRPEQARLLTRWVHYPAGIATGSLVVPFLLADSGDAILQSGGDWLAIYWLLNCSILAYLLSFAALIFKRLRTDPRHQKTADLYIAACVCGILACVDRVAPLALPNLNFPGPTYFQLTATVLKCAWIGLFAWAAARSWQQKTRHFQPVQQVLA